MMQAWVIGNWKQNPATIKDVNSLLDSLLTKINDNDTNQDNQCQLMVAPSCIHLAQVADRVQSSSMLCAAQNISAHSSTTGAYTGDCSAQQVADSGATWTILGHSERRQYHNESHDDLLQKLICAQSQKLGAIFCIGETQEQYDGKQTLKVIDEQLAVIKEWLSQQPEAIKTVDKRLIIAYEPVWAIGTGKVPTVSEVEATHKYIKQKVASFDAGFDDKQSAVTVLYGGSVNADNADSFAASSVIDGALVGGASLKPDSFLAIATAFSQAKSK